MEPQRNSTLLQILLFSTLLAFASPGASAQTVQLSPHALTFADQPIGTTSTGQSIVLTNIDATTSLTISSVIASGNYSVSDDCGTIVPPHGSCTLTVTFSPSVNGTVAGEITVNDNAADSPQLATLTGSGINPLSSSPKSVGFAKMQVGSSSHPKNVTISNFLGKEVTLSFSTTGDYSAAPGATHGCGAFLAANSNCTIAVTFRPTETGTLVGLLSVAYSADFSPLLVQLTGRGSWWPPPPLSFKPTSLGFGKVAVGAISKKKVMTVTNIRGAAVTINGISATTNYTATPSGSNPCNGSLAADASCTISVSFSPSVTGNRAGVLSLSTDDSTGVQEARLGGSGVIPISFSVPGLTFAPQPVGSTSPPQSVTITNKTSASLTILGIQASGQFGVSSNRMRQVAACRTGSTLSPGGKCAFSVTFSPTVIGGIHGVVTVAYNAAYSPSAFPVSGVGTGTGPVSAFAYVPDSGSAYTWVFTIDAASGALSPIPSTPFSSGLFPYGVAVDPLGKFLFEANYLDSNIWVYAINPETGAIAPVLSSPFALAAGPFSAAVDPTGRFLYVTSAGVMGFTINRDTGALTEISGSPFPAGSDPLGLAVDPSGRFVYVADNSGNVFAFVVDRGTGILTAVTGSPFPVGPGPYYVTVDPLDRFLYTGAEYGVWADTIDSNTGALTPVPGSPFPEGSWNVGITVDPTGRFVYAADANGYGPGYVYGYAINVASGALTSVPGSPFAAGDGTWSVAVDPTGKFVYAGNIHSTGVSGYIIDTNTGSLTPMPGSPFPAGSAILSIAIMSKNKN